MRASFSPMDHEEKAIANLQISIQWRIGFEKPPYRAQIRKAHAAQEGLEDAQRVDESGSNVMSDGQSAPSARRTAHYALTRSTCSSTWTTIPALEADTEGQS